MASMIGKGIGGIAFVGLHERFDILCRHHLNLVGSHQCEHATPVVGTAARFNTNLTRRKCFEKTQRLGSREAAVD